MATSLFTPENSFQGGFDFPQSLTEKYRPTRIAANLDRLIQEPTLQVKCQSCGARYSLHTYTVCPKCFAWPNRNSAGEADQSPELEVKP